ncbi:CLUMA_CG021529, isoform A [Clunio marinus]|uniref:CLUMA_CG021529, isoform A n=1 Tax=Clunio marinus TaxID=568069 RepID=A0A1J1J913_9DIPT|nr:CLUMA_CG021529, isoform A [Clunio marinus]
MDFEDDAAERNPLFPVTSSPEQIKCRFDLLMLKLDKVNQTSNENQHPIINDKLISEAFHLKTLQTKL